MDIVITFVILVVVFFLFGIIGAIFYDGSSDPGPSGGYEDRPHVRHDPPKATNEKHFINSYLHRNDEVKARNKRDQTPW